MKFYKVKEEYIDNFGSDYMPGMLLSEDQLMDLSDGWEMSFDDLMEQVESVTDTFQPTDMVKYRIEISELDVTTNSYNTKNILVADGECKFSECEDILNDIIPDESDIDDEDIDIRYRMIVVINGRYSVKIEHWIKADSGESLCWEAL